VAEDELCREAELIDVQQRLATDERDDPAGPGRYETKTARGKQIINRSVGSFFPGDE